ncbi:hypothetical protein SEA_CLARK_32 [Gordonia phage Clark]|uniref:Uncharacterized protein n=1 Tax=Gordonia phage Clark TaxID=2588133 RepID=A0A4Y6EKV0_9CAUD|nr:hypothetical protein PP507_gp32 [Gordonia phage Clark]QDF17981.1 hypothetical protein SEA_CLARK_32 [Gordonia phage Clark]
MGRRRRHIYAPPRWWERTFLHAPVWAWALMTVLVVALLCGIVFGPSTDSALDDLGNTLPALEDLAG